MRRWMLIWFMGVGSVLSANSPVRLAAQAVGGKTLSAASPTPGAKLEFEVASVRQNKSNDPPRSSFSLDSSNLYSTVNKDDVLTPNGGYFSASNQPLWRYIVFAYKLSGTQEMALRFSFFAGLVSKVPAWINSDRFDIKGRFEGHPSKDQVRQMVLALLADRFKLVVHYETRVVPVFAMVLAKEGVIGPNLRPHLATDSCSNVRVEESAKHEPQPVVNEKGFPIVCGVIAHLPPSELGRTSFGGRDVTLELLATSLPTQTGMLTLPRPVIDQTGLAETFDFKVEWLQEFDQMPDATGPTFRKALSDQLGLKLESQKGPIDLIVLDHIEYPSEN